MNIFLCEDTPDGVFTAIYDAWETGIATEELSIQVEKNHAFQLFAEYRYIQTDLEKAVKVARSVSRKLGNRAYDMMFRVALSYELDKCDTIYSFLKKGFSVGPSITTMYTDETVCRMFDLQRNVTFERHSFVEFIRFSETEEGILLGKIRPKNQVLSLLGDHFSDRFPEENFVIIDENHQTVLFHPRRQAWYLAPLEQEILDRIWQHRRKDEYENLWKTFFHSISIGERENYRCQRTHCALRYRDYMVEFH